VELTLLDADAMRRLNRRATGRRGLTDVLAFALPQPDGALLGDVYICPAAAERWVKNGGRGTGEEGRVEEELVRLTVHGTLHVDVQRSVHRQPHELLLHPSLFPRPSSSVLHPALRGGGTDVHIPEERAVGLWQRERQYVGETAPAGGAAVEAAHGVGVEQRELHARAPPPPPAGAFPGQDLPD